MECGQDSLVYYSFVAVPLTIRILPLYSPEFLLQTCVHVTGVSILLPGIPAHFHYECAFGAHNLYHQSSSILLKGQLTQKGLLFMGLFNF